MSTESTETPPEKPSRILHAAALYPPFCVGALVAAALTFATYPEHEFSVLLHCTAFYAIAAIVSWAVVAVPWAVLDVGRAAKPRVPLRTFGRTLVIACLLSAVAWFPARYLADLGLPQSVSRRDSMINVFGHMLAMGLGGCFAIGWAKLRQPESGVQWCVLAVMWVFGYFPQVVTIHSFAPGRVYLCELFGAALLGLTVAATLLQPSASRPTSRLNRLHILSCLAVPAIILVSLTRIGTYRIDRTRLSNDAPGASAIFYKFRRQFDQDGDGFPSRFGGLDCDDSNPDIYPAALEKVGNGVDDNCAGGDLEVYEYPPYGAPMVAAPGSVKRSLILITVDALRADTLSKNIDGKGVAAPQLKTLGLKSTYFRNAYSTASSTGQSLPSLFTGHLPMDSESHGTFMGYEAMLAEFLKSEGYATSVITQIIGIEGYLLRGYDRINRDLRFSNAGFDGKTSRQATDLAIAEFDHLSAGDAPLYLWVQYFDPHVNYIPDADAPFQGSLQKDLYYQDVWQTDRELGRLFRHLEKSGFFEHGDLVLTADHGELIGERGAYGHAFWLDEEVLRVPILIRSALLPAAEVDLRVSTVDLLTTMTELTTGKSLVTDGRSLLPIARGEDRRELPVFARAYYDIEGARALARTVIDGNHKYVQNMLTGVESLHDLNLPEPDEVDLIDEQQQRVAELFNLMGQRWDLSMNDRVAQRKFHLLKQRQLTASESQRNRTEILLTKCVIHSFQEACDELRDLGIKTTPPTP